MILPWQFMSFHSIVGAKHSVDNLSLKTIEILSECFALTQNYANTNLTKARIYLDLIINPQSRVNSKLQRLMFLILKPNYQRVSFISLHLK